MASAETGDLNDPGLHSPPFKSTSPIPRLGEGFQQGPSSLPTASPEEAAAAKTNKRRLFGFGRKKNGEVDPVNQGHQPRSISPNASTHPYQTHSSPSSPYQFRPTTPGAPSSASSQIFERDVQESAVASQASPAIPSHIQTEDHIPPVLEASSLAITDGQLDPDDVEIVMHSAHQPAAVTVTGVGPPHEATTSMWSDDVVAHPDREDTTSNYGTLDNTDVRRLSFISFADVVQAEHVDHASNADFSLPAGLSSAAPHLASTDRSPSPVRSPGSSHGLGTTPPTSVPASLHGHDGSPRFGLRGPGSPTSAYSPPHTGGGELTIETMRQALRKTASGDLGGCASQPLSAVSGDDALNESNSWKQQ